MWDCSDKSNGECYKLLKRDFVYMIVIFIIVGISWFSFTLGTTDEATDRISFAGTLSSIILSVLAIIMTLLSEAKNERTKNSIDEALANLRKTESDMQERSQQQINQLKEIDVELKGRFLEISKRLDKIDNSVRIIVKSGGNTVDNWVGEAGDRHE